MRFFTPRWYRTYEPAYYRGEWFTRAAKSVFLDYDAHLARMEFALPPRVLELARLPGVDDGLIVEARWSKGRRDLSITLRCGDHPMGYFDLCLTYRDAEMSGTSEWTLSRLARGTNYENGTYPDIAYHELDRAHNGDILHGFLFHPGHTFTVRCRELEWRREDRPGRDLPLLPDRFPGGPPSAPPLKASRWTPHRSGLDRGRARWEPHENPSPSYLRWELREKRVDIRRRSALPAAERG